MLPLSAALLVLLGRTIAIDDVLACPSADQVGAALDRLFPLPGGPGSQSPTRIVELRRDADGLVLTLREGSGRVLGQRSLRGGGPCKTIAETVAVVLAAWEAELARTPSPAPPAERPLTAPGPSLSPSGTPANAPEPEESEAPQPPPPPPRLLFGAAIGAVVSASTGGTAPGVLLRATARRGWYGGELTLWGEGQRGFSIGGGGGTWDRNAATAGFVLSATDGFLGIELVPQMSAALFSLGTSGFAPNVKRHDPDFGFGAGVRLSLAYLVRPYVELTGVAWPIGRQLGVLSAPGGPTAFRFPAFELLLSAGVAFEEEP